VKALPGRPYDGHTLGVVIPEIETQVGANLERVVVDRGCRGHNAPPKHRFKVYISGQKRRVTEAIKCDLRRRSAVEPFIGHLKSEHPAFRKALRTAADFPYRAALQCRYALSSGGATGRHEGRSGGGAVKMREMPLRDASGVSGYVREDGRVMKDMFAYRVKSSKKSKADWDLLRIVGTVSKEDVNFPLSQSLCPFVKK
jgi:hypothetical protein